MEKSSELLINSVHNIISRSLRNISFDKIGLVDSVSGDICTVMINKASAEVKNGIGVPFKQGDKCLVHYINGNQSQKIIIAKL